MFKKLNTKGMSHHLLLPVIAVLLVIGIGGFIMARISSAATYNTNCSNTVIKYTATKPYNKGTCVKTVQTQLIKLGYLAATSASGKTNADGVFGPGTNTAIKNFQKDYGLAQNGLGPKTWGELWNPYAKKTTSNAAGPSVASCATKSLKPGVTTACVKTLQKALHDVGTFAGTKYTTYYGTATKGAVKSYQEKVGLYNDGWAGTCVWYALQNYGKHKDGCKTGLVSTTGSTGGTSSSSGSTGPHAAGYYRDETSCKGAGYMWGYSNGNLACQSALKSGEPCAWSNALVIGKYNTSGKCIKQNGANYTTLTKGRFN